MCYDVRMIKLDANWKFLFWLLMIGLAFLGTKVVADYYGYVGGPVVTIYMVFYLLVALIIFALWVKFFKDNYLN